MDIEFTDDERKELSVMMSIRLTELRQYIKYGMTKNPSRDRREQNLIRALSKKMGIEVNEYHAE